MTCFTHFSKTTASQISGKLSTISIFKLCTAVDIVFCLHLEISSFCTTIRKIFKKLHSNSFHNQGDLSNLIIRTWTSLFSGNLLHNRGQLGSFCTLSGRYLELHLTVSNSNSFHNQVDFFKFDHQNMYKFIFRELPAESGQVVSSARTTSPLKIFHYRSPSKLMHR